MIEISTDINSIVSQIAEAYRTTLRNAGKVASGNLVNFTYNIQQDNRYFTIVFNLPEYWKYVENGRKAGAKFPPINKIEQWIQIKPSIPRAINGKIPTTKQLAFLIARAIHTNGIQPTKALQNTINSPQVQNLEDKLCDLILEQLENEIREEEI